MGQPVESLLLAVPVHQRFEFIQHLFGGCLIFAAREEVGFQLRLRAGGADDDFAAIRQREGQHVALGQTRFIVLVVDAGRGREMRILKGIQRGA